MGKMALYKLRKTAVFAHKRQRRLLPQARHWREYYCDTIASM